jgi:signal transduction histidine kinase/ActR/RegA family two-component response regulator
MNPLLARQLRKLNPTLDPSQEPWRSFLATVSDSYDEFQREQRFLSHTLEVASTELTEANEKLRDESETQLEALNEHYQTTLELQQGMILCFRKTERGYEHTLCRGQLAHRLGWAPKLVEGKLPRDFVPPAQLAVVESAYARAWSGNACTFEGRSIDGGVVYLSLLRPLVHEGKVVEVIVSAVEITALKRLEMDLRSAKETAEAADRAKSEFLAVMSHEIRTPLNAILGFTQLLTDSPLTEEQRSWVRTVGSSGEALRALIEDILDFSKIEAGMLELEESPVVLSDLLQSVASMFQPRVVEKGLHFSLSLADDLPESIATDPDRLRQILINLINNAVKFTETGYIRVSAAVVEKTQMPEGTRWLLRFDVCDSGIGIKSEHRDRLFKPFSQADSSTTRVYGGTGLGLAICQRLARALGGDANYESEYGRGSCFYFTIRAGEANVPKKAVSVFSPKALSQLPKLRVLTVEDQPTNRLLMKQIFRRFGMNVDFAENGRQAVTAAMTTTYDLIIMDLQMPDMDGIEATRQIRAMLDGRMQPRIIALTASALREQHDRCIEVGMDSVLTKPVKLDVLFTELARTRPLEPV